MNELDKIVRIKNKIYEIRGIEVMLDSDLAELYQCANGTKTINQAVKRNMERFPSDFYFQLTENEIDYVSRSQTGTLKIEQGHNVKYLPYAFTEQGIAMLATVLRTKVAVETSIDIMRAFVKMRNYIRVNINGLPHRVLLLEDRVDNNEKRIDKLFNRFNPKTICYNHILYKGELYKSHSLLVDITNSAKKEIIIIDNYASKELLDIIKDVNKRIIIISENIDEQSKIKYEKEYSNIEFIKDNSFHDRFIIIDSRKVYHCGASFKDLGKKTFGISEIKTKEVKNPFIQSVLSIIEEANKPFDKE